MAGGSRKIVVEFLGKDVSAGSTATAVESKFGKLGGRMDKVGQVAGKALAGGLLLGGAALVKMGQAAAEDQVSATKLAVALKNNAGATKAQVAATEDWITAQGKAYGVADDDLRPALIKLTAATHDVGKAQSLTRLAMDISAGSGQSLASVTKALAKAQNGQVAGLSKLGIKTQDSTKDAAALEAAQTKVKQAQLAYNQAVEKYGPSSAQASIANDKFRQAQEKVGAAQAKVQKTTIDMDEAVKRLSKTYNGQAAKAAETTAGKQKRLQLELREMGETIGYNVIPVMLKLANVGLSVADWASKHAKLVLILGGVLTGLAATLWVTSLAMRASAGELAIWNAITKVAAGFQWLLNAALEANPIGLVVLAIAALVAGLIIAYKNSETFRAIVQGAFEAVKNAAATAFNWVKDHWPLILAIITGPIGLAVYAVVKHWDAIKAGATAVKDWIAAKFGDLVGFFTGMPAKISKAASGMWDGIKDSFKGIINAIIRMWNNLSFSLPSVSIAGHQVFGGVTISTPNIPYLAKGGIVKARTGGTLVNAGEGGRDEAVIPLNRNGTPAGGIGGDGTVAMFTIPVMVDGRQVQTSLLALKRRNGGLELGLA